MLDTTADGYAAYARAWARGLLPDPPLWVDAWAETHMHIPQGKGAEPGKYRAARTPYAVEPMRCLSPEHPSRRVVMKVASQLMKTQVSINWICAVIHQAPANIIALLPTDDLAKRISGRLDQTFRLVAPLQNRVARRKSRDNRNTLGTKEFNGGTLWVMTGRSASNLSEASARYVYVDEVDRLLRELRGEGDPISLVEKRASTYGHNAKFGYTSSPTDEDASRIDELYRQGDQRRYWVPCPHCGEYQVLEWENLTWNGDDYDSARYACEHCGTLVEEHAKAHMLPRGEWRAEAQGDGETVSFHLSALYMPLGWTSWPQLAREYAKAKAAHAQGDSAEMQVFWNTRLARCWSHTANRLRAVDLKERAEDFPLGIAPLGVLELTCAVDVQDNRLEALTCGWGYGPAGLELWTVQHQVLMGDPTLDDVWRELDRYLTTPVAHAGGRLLVIRAVAIDSGGHHTQEVYEFTRRRQRRHIGIHDQKVLAVKGASKPNKPVISNKAAKVDVNWRGRIEQRGAELWLIGTDTAKDWLHNRYALKSPAAVHLSRHLEDSFFDQLVAERKETRWKNGYRRVEWTKKRGEANEAGDLMVYNLAMAQHRGLHKHTEKQWERIRNDILPPAMDLFAPANPEPPPPQSIQPVIPRVVPTPGGLSLDGWKRGR